MKILAAAFTALVGLFFLAIAMVAVLRGGDDWPIILGNIISSALMALVGITSIRVAGYILRRSEKTAIEGEKAWQE